MTFRTPGGSRLPATSSAKSKASNGDSGAGLSTTVQPASSAGTVLPMVRNCGMFHGTMAATTPTGCLASGCPCRRTPAGALSIRSRRPTCGTPTSPSAAAAPDALGEADGRADLGADQLGHLARRSLYTAASRSMAAIRSDGAAAATDRHRTLRGRPRQRGRHRPAPPRVPIGARCAVKIYDGVRARRRPLAVDEQFSSAVHGTPIRATRGSGAAATVDADDLPGDVAGLLGDQERARGGDVLGQPTRRTGMRAR